MKPEHVPCWHLHSSHRAAAHWNLAVSIWHPKVHVHLQPQERHPSQSPKILQSFQSCPHHQGLAAHLSDCRLQLAQPACLAWHQMERVVAMQERLRNDVKPPLLSLRLWTRQYVASPLRHQTLPLLHLHMMLVLHCQLLAQCAQQLRLAHHPNHLPMLHPDLRQRQAVMQQHQILAQLRSVALAQPAIHAQPMSGQACYLVHVQAPT